MFNCVSFTIKLFSAPLLKKRRQSYKSLLFPVPKDTIKTSHHSIESHRQYSHSRQTVLQQKQGLTFPKQKAKRPQASPSMSLNHFTATELRFDLTKYRMP